MADKAQLFYTKIRTKNEKLVGSISDASVSPVEIGEMPHSFSWEEERIRGYDQELKIKMQGVDRPLAEMWRLKENKVKLGWRVKSDPVSWSFFGYIHSIEEGFVDGIFESNYVIRGFKIIKVENGATSRKREYSNKNLRPLRRKKSGIATKDAPRSKRNRARVREADLVQLPMGGKKRVRGKDAATVRDRKPSRKSNGSKLKCSRS